MIRWTLTGTSDKLYTLYTYDYSLMYSPSLHIPIWCHPDPHSLPMHAWWALYSQSLYSYHSLPLFLLKQKRLVWRALITSLIGRRGSERNRALSKRKQRNERKERWPQRWPLCLEGSRHSLVTEVCIYTHVHKRESVVRSKMHFVHHFVTKQDI